MSNIKQHIVVDISNESFVTNPYNSFITGGVDVSGIGRTIIRTDGTTELTNSLTVKNIHDDTVKITNTDLDISGTGNINMNTIGNAIFSSNNNSNNVTISSETIIIDGYDNSGLHIIKQNYLGGGGSVLLDDVIANGLSNNGDIIISQHGNCSSSNAIGGSIQFRASPHPPQINPDNNNYSLGLEKCAQIAFTHNGNIGNDTWIGNDIGTSIVFSIGRERVQQYWY